MRFLYFLVLLFFLALTLSSCTNDEGDDSIEIINPEEEENIASK